MTDTPIPTPSTSVGIVAVTLRPLRLHLYGTTLLSYRRLLTIWDTFKHQLSCEHTGVYPSDGPRNPFRYHHLDVERHSTVDGDVYYLVCQKDEEPEVHPIKVELSTEATKALLVDIFKMLQDDRGKAFEAKGKDAEAR